VEAPLARRAQLKVSSGDSKRILIRLLLYQVYTCWLLTNNDEKVFAKL
jgi:hypothetical protein